jgi:hypothetical protein
VPHRMPAYRRMSVQGSPTAIRMVLVSESARAERPTAWLVSLCILKKEEEFELEWTTALPCRAHGLENDEHNGHLKSVNCQS